MSQLRFIFIFIYVFCLYICIYIYMCIHIYIYICSEKNIVLVFVPRVDSDK